MTLSRLKAKVENKLNRYQIDYDVQIARTRSRYYKLRSKDGVSSIEVRVSDHNDVYQTADITINPMRDEFSELDEWVKKHGNKKPRKTYKGQFNVYGVKGNDLVILATEMTKKTVRQANYPRVDKVIISKEKLFTGALRVAMDEVDLSKSEEI